MTANPCLTCGACCAYFRVSMYWGETSAHPNGTVPEHLTEPINPHYVAMRGTHTTQGAAKRCIALRGNVGEQTSCEIYAHRSSTCASVHAGDSQCAKARAAHHLPPFLTHNAAPQTP